MLQRKMESIKMHRPDNSAYIVLGEMNLVVTAMRRVSRAHLHHQVDEQDPLLSNFSQLKVLLNKATDFNQIAPNEFLSPFLEVIRSEDTTGPITGLALTSVNKFLSYGMIDVTTENSASAIENIADAVTHARFVGTDPGSDEVVLMKIIHVLRTLLLTPAGVQLSNESVCEIMQSCFRICFETRLSDLLRKSAEHTLMDMVQLLFTRLPQFKEDVKWTGSMKKLKMRTGAVDSARNARRKRSPKPPKHRRSADTAPQASSPSSHTTATITSQVQPAPNANTTTTAYQSDDITAQESHPRATSPSQAMTTHSHPSETAEEDARAATATSEIPADATSQPSSDCSGSPHSAVMVNSSDIPALDHVQCNSEEGTTRQAATGGNDVMRGEGGSGAGQEREVGIEDDDMVTVEPVIATTPVTGLGTVVDIQESFQEALDKDKDEARRDAVDKLQVPGNQDDGCDRYSDRVSDIADDMVLSTTDLESSGPESMSHDADMDYVNPRGVRFTQTQQTGDGSAPAIPYGLPCVRELFRFLISLTNKQDRHNTDTMTHMGMSLLTVALESGADHITSFTSLLALVKNDMCRNLFSLLHSERLTLFTGSIRVCFLLFEAIRGHLKFQLEMYINKLIEVIVSDSLHVTHDLKEIALEAIVQLLRIPGFVTEVYLNYDADLFCANVFEDLMKLLSKNAFPVDGLSSTHLLSLDALLTVIDSIEHHCCMKTRQATQTQESKEVASPVNAINQLRPNRMKVSPDIPTETELAAIKQKKRIYQTGTEQFNIKPSKGIAFLQEQGLLSDPLDPGEVVTFLKENPSLDKKMIGEYISNKKFPKVLEAFHKSFNFENTRIDESLRMFLETFRLPGEAPVISYLLEHFSEHWHKMNGEPFADVDAAFTLSYAVLMLNTDQHNTNARKQNIPMNLEQFKKNLTKCNGGNNFDSAMLDEIYHAIRQDEIVMPAEQTGIVKENYMWKVLLRRGQNSESNFKHVPTGLYDRDLFAIAWGPSAAALSFVFDKSLHEAIFKKAIAGFEKCATISAYYELSDVFDNLVISLCKFTTLLSASESPELLPISFGSNRKAQIAARTVFGLSHTHGHILREGWKNILDCMLQLFHAKMLPELLIKAEDFVDPSGRISLIKEDSSANQRSDSGVLSSFYSYFLTESTPQRGHSPEEQEYIKQTQRCIQECHLEQVITDSKFLREDSLLELLKALMFASRCLASQEFNGSDCDESAAIFYLELLIKVVLQNRDRVCLFYQSIRDHLYNLIVNASEPSALVERAVVGLLRLAIRLLRRDEIAPQVLSSLKMLLLMRPAVIHAVCRQVSAGLHDLLRTNAANIHMSDDWFTLFTLLEVVGAGTNPPPVMHLGNGGLKDLKESIDAGGCGSDTEHASDTTADTATATADNTDSSATTAPPPAAPPAGGTSGGSAGVRNSPITTDEAAQHQQDWTFVNREDVDMTRFSSISVATVNQYNIVLEEELKHRDNKSLVKSCETLAFLVRDAAHVTPHNFESCVHAIRTFVEASVNGGYVTYSQRQRQEQMRQQQQNRRSFRRRDEYSMRKSKSTPGDLSRAEDGEEGDKETDTYHLMSIQLLDLMHTLHTRAASIFKSWAEEEELQRSISNAKLEPYLEGLNQPVDAGVSTLWKKCWCPLLQGIARLCCDTRLQVRSQALTYLQRALLVHDQYKLSAYEWESCFNKVLFPLLYKLLENINQQDASGVEETRMRASALLCKVFLQHLTQLVQLATFTALWLTILDFMDKYMHIEHSELLSEAIPESLKNMLLVMHTAGVLGYCSEADQSKLSKMTWERISVFMPALKGYIYQAHQPTSEPQSSSINRGGESSPPQSASPPPPAQSPSPPPPSHDTQQQQQSSPQHTSPATDTQPSAATHTTRPASPPSATTSLPPRANTQESPPGTLTTQPQAPSPVQGGNPAHCSPVHGSPIHGSPTHGSPVHSPSSPVLHRAASSPAAQSQPVLQLAAQQQQLALQQQQQQQLQQPLSNVPILLNPDLIHGTNIPIISPQSTPERKSDAIPTSAT